MTPQELKNSILQLAIQGRLVPQCPEEGTAEELYKRIQAEKQALIKAGKIKKDKPLSEITEDEKPFDIPESWMWVRLGSVFCLEMGQSPDGSSVSETANGIEFHQGKVFFGKKYLEQSPQKTSAPTKIVEPNSVLLCVRAPVGKVNIATRKICIGRGLCSVFPITGMSADFVYYLLATFETTFIRQATGTTFVAITGEVVKNQPIPLPPLSEQKRIVAKIEELLPLIDRYEKAWSRLEDFNKRFPGDMQKSILQMAIQGKLVEQRPEEGTAEELYRQIQAEKQALIKAGKIKKDKPLPEITEDEIPFEIPESWRWIQIGEICSVVTGRLDANAQDPNGAYAFFTCGVEVYKTKDYAFDCDAVLLGGNNASGDYKMHRYVGKFNAYQRVYVITDPPKETLDYLFYVIKWRLPSLKHNSQGTTTRFIKLGQVTGMLVPFPPLAEQKRIVAKLEELLPLCERLN